ncbi:hypothetical protein QGP82_00020 [Leptothoe sp. LEGE 181152]|uniref:Uncharacterized protein n=1 Tax=Adonisia turfae CCMR0081 TaxID=2292702 RepID=A0A6M0RKQ4_9CYAN|nr:hypothetical protein [Adonisia turfae]MDV3347065.1 hypothetical protein [Leptothoe sp. LEGE 181152]NEZ56470.1 hypothetical protein [Adonisia turfae CCMR0081]
MMKKFEFEFEDLSSQNTIEFDYDEEIDEELKIVIENGMPVLYANKQAYIALAKTFIRMALGEYSNGFHVHLNQDLDADEQEIMRCHI